MSAEIKRLDSNKVHILKRLAGIIWFRIGLFAPEFLETILRDLWEVTRLSNELRGKFSVKVRVRRERVWKDMLNSIENQNNILILEFGVADGYATSWWLKQLSCSSDSRYFGFDTFKGLETNWRKLESGTFNKNGLPPDLKLPKNWKFVIGDVRQEFDDKFMKNLDFDGVRIFMFDLDLAEPSKYVFDKIINRLRKNDILYFDELKDESEFQLLIELMRVRKCNLISTTFTNAAFRIL